MGLFDFMKKKEPEAPKSVLPQIHHIVFGGAVTIDPLAIKTLGQDHTLFGKVPEKLVVTGQSAIEFEDGVTLHRFYTDDDHMLQIMGGDGFTHKDVDQVSYFLPVDSYVPGRGELGEVLTAMRQPSFEWNGHVYDRAWADGDGEADLVELHETVHLAADGSDHYDISQACMLFTREVDDAEESLLVIHEKTDEGGSTISIMAGVLLSPNDVYI